MNTCGKCGHENPPGNRFCGSCGAPVEARATGSREVRKVVTIVFSDVTGSTSLGERLDAESLRRVMARYFDEMRAVLERHGGTVEKFIGDAVMAVFGIPRLHEDDALRAVRAAADMALALEDLNGDLNKRFGVELEIRTGINTGEVVAGDPAGGQALVTGDAVNVAARLEQSAQPGEILMGQTTYQLVRDAVIAEPLEPLTLKGKSAGVPALRLLRVDRDAPGLSRRLESPMVGREREQALLSQALERAVEDRACQLFTILGSAGVGKSRLVSEFLDAARVEAGVVTGRCLSYGEGITFWPLAEAIREASGIGDGDGHDAARAKLAAVLGD
ncbi:MAG: adenylate/guanylate cyclase domain-containing protein, partial [Actinomycetota bacterium]